MLFLRLPPSQHNSWFLFNLSCFRTKEDNHNSHQPHSTSIPQLVGHEGICSKSTWGQHRQSQDLINWQILGWSTLTIIRMMSMWSWSSAQTVLLSISSPNSLPPSITTASEQPPLAIITTASEHHNHFRASQLLPSNITSEQPSLLGTTASRRDFVFFVVFIPDSVSPFYISSYSYCLGWKRCLRIRWLQFMYCSYFPCVSLLFLVGVFFCIFVFIAHFALFIFIFEFTWCHVVMYVTTVKFIPLLIHNEMKSMK